MQIKSISGAQNFGMAKLIGDARIMAIIALNTVANNREKRVLQNSLRTIANNYVDHYVHNYQLGSKNYLRLSGSRNKWLALLQAPTMSYSADSTKPLDRMFNEFAVGVEKKISRNKTQKQLDFVDKLSRN